MRIAWTGAVLTSTALAGLLFISASAQDRTLIEGTSRAYDGDGVYVGGVKIRLWGIDAPELGTPAGRASHAALANYIDGSWLRCVPPPNQSTFPNSWDRTVALCTSAGVDVARVQVQQNHARDWPKFSRGYYE